jgi:hypothetical protein
MPERHHIPRLLLLLIALLAVGLLGASAASADPFGELGHLSGGTKGTAPGEFKLGAETRAFGVDPTDNSVYIVDLPNPTKNEFRLQKFSSNSKGELKFVAGVTFEPNSKGETDTVEGVAIDPTLHRAYVLSIEERGEHKKVDPEEEVASKLFAFSTEQNGSELAPATGTVPSGAEKGLLAGESLFKSQGLLAGEFLLEPQGITVDPSSHDIIIDGLNDTGKKAENGTQIWHSELWWVSSDGTSIAKKYEDTTESLEEAASSPVVDNGKVYVNGEEGIYEIPASLTGPATLITGPVEPEIKEELAFYEEQEIWNEGGSSFNGGNLTVDSEGRFWSAGKIRNTSAGNFEFAGAISFDAAGREIGWTGGQSNKNGPTCTVVTSETAQGPTLVAAGKNHEVFLLYESPVSTAARLIQLGPEGKGCPQASASKPAAFASGVAVEEGKPIAISSTVEFTSELTQANALSVEWSFGDGSAPVIESIPAANLNKPGTPTTAVTHKFLKSGTLEVVEKIHTDDLASPTLEVTSKVLISASAPSATTEAAKLTGPVAAQLKGTVNAANSTVEECVFEYGESTSYGKTVKCNPEKPTGNAPVAVTAVLEGLKEHTTYHFRLHVKSSSGEATTADRQFTTTPPPLVTTEGSQGVTTSGATVTAKVNPQGAAITACKFEYGPTASYGSSVACGSLPGAVSEAVTVSAAITGLAASTPYHYRIVATSANGSSTGSDATLTTAAEVVAGGGGNTGGGGGSTGGGGGSTGGGGGSTGGGGVLTYKAAAIALAGGSVKVPKSGAFKLKLACPAGTGLCSGTIVLEFKVSKKKTVKLTTGKFSLTAGQSTTLTLHLSGAAKALLKRLHTLHAKAKIVARNQAGTPATTAANVTLKRS